MQNIYAPVEGDELKNTPYKNTFFKTHFNP